MKNKAMIEFKNVTFKYNSQSEPTLKHVSLTIDQGEKVLIVGPSGSGKSTLGNLINGIIPENIKGEIQGTILVNGHDVKDMSIFDQSLNVSSMLQDSNDQFVGLTVAEDIAFGMENDCTDNVTMRKKVKAWSDYLHIHQLLKQSPNSLSGGQKQRTSLAGVLVDESPILLLDEPLAALDPAAGLRSIQLLDDIHKHLRNTVIIIEHRIEEVLTQDVDRVVLMDDGKIVGSFTPDNLLKRDILKNYGLRNPLYLDALKLAGVDFNSLSNIDSVNLVNGNHVNDKLHQLNLNQATKRLNQSTDPILKINDLSFAYNHHPIFKHLNLTIYKGDMISLVGKNGVGKSTLSKLIAGFIKPNHGKIIFNHRNLSNLSIKERADHIGYIMQDPDKMISQVMIRDEIALGLKLRHYPKSQIDAKVKQALKVCKLYEFRNWPVSALSYGQKKRLTIASILVLNPELLILDEPTAGQDYYHYNEIMQFLRKLNQERHLTMIFITHDMYLMTEYSNRTIVLGNQNIMKDAAPEKVLNDDQLLLASHLRKTSLSILAKRFHIDPIKLTNTLITKERENDNGQ
ncbi:ABC transporter ATP-binding protein [Philodulcilactobacillus myokoensis]|uniref:ABC transporter ATP-binding protein n=1 Tax=Philodulcilactobacillus myokoensis TaxID=2929573 RepID=A0A9W6B3A5_9LACO|nr:DUF3744 domain-containing protein [Philodulcilactobacillus myokoensis]GLB47628.1 ABC transporter ATP-binding protein [Philodulcilactobacillus myokoensis]